jgi:hypothetical protein
MSAQPPSRVIPPTPRGSGRPRPDFADQERNDGALPNAVSLSDRDLHDEVIRYLTDADARAAESCGGLLDEADSERAIRFARFLARRYYRDRLHRAFRHSASRIPESRRADQIVDGPQFDQVLAKCFLGSLVTAQAVGEMAVATLKPMRHDVWWNELLQYEYAFFLQLAISELEIAGAFPKRGRSNVVRAFTYCIPELLQSLRSHQVSSEGFQGEVVLSFSRTPHGKIYVVELESTMRSILERIDGASSVADIARSAGVSLEEARHSLSRLAELGAVIMAIPAPDDPVLTTDE